MSKNTWGTHVYRIGNEENLDVQDPDDSKSIELQKKHIEPWLAAVFQSEHLALLLGSGFTKAVAYQAGTSAADMACDYGGFPLGDNLKDAAKKAARAMGRGEANAQRGHERTTGSGRNAQRGQVANCAQRAQRGQVAN